MTYGELAYRVPLPAIIKKNPDLFGAVAFVNATAADHLKSSDEITNKYPNYQHIEMFKYVDTGAGIGLRVMVIKKTRANLTHEYAWGKYGSQGFYFNFNETF